MPTGTVHSFDYIHGTGFIGPDDGSERVKIVNREIDRDGYKILHEGQRVEYTLWITPRGPVAKKILPRE